MKFNNRAQATTELAIFGSLILICFAILISYGQNMQEQQILQQQAFRKALKKAYDENAFVSYNIIKNPRTINIFGGYGEGGRGGTSAAASVNWLVEMSGEEEVADAEDSPEKSYYQVNEDTIEIPLDTKIVDVETEAGTTYVAQETRSEGNLGISSRKRANLVETLTTRLKINEVKGRMGKIELRCEFVYNPQTGGYDTVCEEVEIPYSEQSRYDIVVTQGLDSDGRYRQSAVGTEISKEREWVTPHAE